MRPKGGIGVGCFSILFEIGNYGDMIKARDGMLAPEKVRRLMVTGVVDSAAARLVLPRALVKQLGLPIRDQVKVRYADGRTGRRRTAIDAYVQILGREGVFTAIVEPKRTTALIGAIVLEDFDLLVDSAHHRVVPRDPRFVINGIE